MRQVVIRQPESSVYSDVIKPDQLFASKIGDGGLYMLHRKPDDPHWMWLSLRSSQSIYGTYDSIKGAAENMINNGGEVYEFSGPIEFLDWAKKQIETDK